MNKDITNKKLLNVTEVGKVLGIGKIKVYDLIRSGFLPALNLGGLKVRQETIDDFLIKYEGYNLSDINKITKLNI